MGSFRLSILDISKSSASEEWNEASVVFEDGGYGHACLLGQPRKADSVAERHGHVSVFCQVKIPKRRERQRLLGAAEQIVEISGVDRFPTDVLEKVFFGLGLWLG